MHAEGGNSVTEASVERQMFPNELGGHMRIGSEAESGNVATQSNVDNRMFATCFVEAMWSPKQVFVLVLVVGVVAMVVAVLLFSWLLLVLSIVCLLLMLLLFWLSSLLPWLFVIVVIAVVLVGLFPMGPHGFPMGSPWGSTESLSGVTWLGQDFRWMQYVRIQKMHRRPPSRGLVPHGKGVSWPAITRSCRHRRSSRL